MPGRPIHSQSLAEYFRELRESRGLGQRQAAAIADRQGIKGVTYGALVWLESGKTKHPGAELLLGLSKLYKVSYEALVETVTQHLYKVQRGKYLGSDLERQTRTPSSESQADSGARDGTSARLLAEERRLRQKFTKRLERIERDLYGLMVDLKDRDTAEGAAAPAADRGRRNSKAG